MRIGSIDYSSKATKLIAALMVCVLVFTLAIPAQPAEAVAGTTVALAAGLTLAFVAACGVTFTVNEAQNSSYYWEGQIEDYMAENNYSSVDEWVDFGRVVFDASTGILSYPGAVLSGLLDFFSWFTGKNSITAGGSTSLISLGGFYDDNTGDFISVGSCSVISSNSAVVDSSTLTFGTPFLNGSNYIYTSNGVSIEISLSATVGTFICRYNNSNYSYNLGSNKYRGDTQYLATCSNYGDDSVNRLYCVYQLSNGNWALAGGPDVSYISFVYGNNYTATGSDVVGLPDLEEKEAELGYVPDINIPLPESVAADTNIGDINDAATAVLDYAGTAGNTLELEHEYVVEDTNVDTGTDTETGEGTQEGTGTQTGSLILENVAADSLVEVAPETMLNDDTLMGLFISKFPWCIPFDLYFAISAFAADPVAPEFEVNLFEGVSWEGLDLSGTEMTLSFEAFEKVAAVTRWSTLIVFCAGLAMITKRMIWS